MIDSLWQLINNNKFLNKGGADMSCIVVGKEKFADIKFITKIGELVSLLFLVMVGL